MESKRMEMNRGKKEEVREILLQLEQVKKRHLQPKFLEIGLTLGQGQPRILKTLYMKEPMTQRDLAELCDVDVTTISRTLDRMEEQGFLERQKNPQCRRSFLIALTKDGTQRAKKVIAAFEETDERIWYGFEEKEMEQLIMGLKKIYKNLSEES